VPCYHTLNGSPSRSVAELSENARRSLEQGAGGIKVEIGQSDPIQYLTQFRDRLGKATPLMVNANQQWDRATALRIGRALEPLGLTWLEAPLDAHDIDGLAALAAALVTPIAVGEPLTDVDEHWHLMQAAAADYLQPDAPRVGGITPFLRIATLANQKRLAIAPHFAAELHVHLAAAYPGTAWIEHVTWLEPLFNERLELKDGTVLVPDRAGIGLTLSERSRMWTTDRIEFAESV
jgi:L-alanine-DL-glutamate epimerase-like enolase superfamily enzyme